MLWHLPPPPLEKEDRDNVAQNLEIISPREEYLGIALINGIPLAKVE